MCGDPALHLPHLGERSAPTRFEFTGHEPIGRVRGIVLPEGTVGRKARRKPPKRHRTELNGPSRRASSYSTDSVSGPGVAKRQLAAVAPAADQAREQPLAHDACRLELPAAIVRTASNLSQLT